MKTYPMETYFINFPHVSAIFLGSNKKVICKIQKAHRKKLHNLFFLITIESKLDDPEGGCNGTRSQTGLIVDSL